MNVSATGPRLGRRRLLQLGAAGLTVTVLGLDSRSAFAADDEPIRWVSRNAPPMWLGYGTADTTVKPKNSINLAHALQAAGATAELRTYPGKTHVDLVKGLSKPFRGDVPTLAESAAFLKAHSR